MPWTTYSDILQKDAQRLLESAILEWRMRHLACTQTSHFANESASEYQARYEASKLFLEAAEESVKKYETLLEKVKDTLKGTYGANLYGEEDTSKYTDAYAAESARRKREQKEDEEV